MCVLAIGAVVLLAPFASPPAATATEPTVEDQVTAYLNADRTDPLVVHMGLQAAARGHSREMSMRGGLDHDGADERVANAPPDPVETNGAPDDGFPIASWCENVTYSVGTSEAEAARRIYDAWFRSGAHHRCMMDTERNVGAVGVYYDGQSWWATFIAEIDNSPPGGTPRRQPEPADKVRPSDIPVASPESTPESTSETNEPDHVSTVTAPTPDPIGLLSPAPDEAATTEPSVRAEQPQPSAPARTSVDIEPLPAAKPLLREGAVPLSPPAQQAIGWQELLAVAGVLGVGTFLLRGSLRRPSLTRPEELPLEERELVGAGSMQ